MKTPHTCLPCALATVETPPPPAPHRPLADSARRADGPPRPGPPSTHQRPASPAHGGTPAPRRACTRPKPNGAVHRNVDADFACSGAAGRLGWTPRTCGRHEFGDPPALPSPLLCLRFCLPTRSSKMSSSCSPTHNRGACAQTRGAWRAKQASDRTARGSFMRVGSSSSRCAYSQFKYPAQKEAITAGERAKGK